MWCRSRFGSRSVFPLLLYLVLAAWLPFAQRAFAQLRPFTTEEKAQIAERLLSTPEMRTLGAETAGERLRVLNVVPVEMDKAEHPAQDRRLAEVTLVQYRGGEAFRVRVDAATGEEITTERLRGRPQSSVEEREEARALVRRSLQIPERFDLVGGFVVEPPSGAPAKGRYLEFHVVGEDRLRIEREVVADLATGKVVSDRRRGDD